MAGRKVRCTMVLTLWAMLITLGVLTLPALAILSPFIVRKLAEMEKFWGTCQEGQARAVTWNKKFRGFIMSYTGRCFAGELDTTLLRNQEEYWEVVTDARSPKEKGRVRKLFEGIYWLGVFPFAEIQRYRMTWIEWGYAKKDGQIVSVEKAPIPHDEIISHILVQSDIYFVRVSSAETTEGVPVDVSFLLTIVITNPYKASYRVQHWLELVTNQTEGSTRIFIGMKEATELFTLKEKPEAGKLAAGALTLSPTSSEELEKFLRKNLDAYRGGYGVWVEKIQIQSVEPGGPDAKKYRELLTKKYEAERNAEQVRIAADAERYKIETIAAAQKKAAQEVFATIAEIDGGVEMYHSQQVGGLQGLNVYTEGDRNTGGSKRDKKPIIAITPNIGEKK